MGTDRRSTANEPVRGDEAKPEGFAVYEFYDVSGAALYVGVTKNVRARHRWHRDNQPWWTDVDHERTIVTYYPTAKDASRAERSRIETARPTHNLAGITRSYIPYTLRPGKVDKGPKLYTVSIETSVTGTPSPEEVDAAMDALGEYGAALSLSPHGYRAARITFPADSFSQAASTAVAVVSAALGGDPVRLELMSESEADLRDGTAELPELVGVTDAAVILGVSPQRVRQMIDEGKIAAHRVGGKSFALIRSEVEAKATPAT